MFTLTAIEHRYDAAPVLRVEAWGVAARDHWLLSGPSGSGKTTLLHILAGLTVPTSGGVSVNEVNLATLSGSTLDRWRGRNVGLVPQRLHLIGALDVLGNLALARYLAGLPVDASRARELLDAMGIGELARRYPRQLSQGQAQRVAIARAVINRPALLLADEPTANLDDAQCAAALDLLRRQAEASGATLVVASHDARVRAVLPAVYALTPCAVVPA